MLRAVIFITIYLVIYGGMHLYWYRKWRRAYAPQSGIRYAVIAFLLLMLFGPMLVRGLETLELSSIARPFAFFTYLWMGLLFMSAAAFFAIDLLHLLRRVLHLPAPGLRHAVLFVTVTAVCAAAAGYGWYAARQLQVESLTIASDKLPEGVARYRVVLISDVHLGVTTDGAWLGRVIDRVNASAPDLIIATGDVIDSRVPSALPFVSQLAQLQAPDGKYAVAGNHEFFAGIDRAVAYLEGAGFEVLRGESVQATPWLRLSGVDDREGRHMDGAQLDHETPLMAAADPAQLHLLLKHQPVVLDESLGRFDVQFSGHVHQGQVFPFGLFTWLAYPVELGLNDLGQGSRLYVSRGTGTWGPPMRVLAPPEITIIDFVRN